MDQSQLQRNNYRDQLFNNMKENGVLDGLAKSFAYDSGEVGQTGAMLLRNAKAMGVSDKLLDDETMHPKIMAYVAAKKIAAYTADRYMENDFLLQGYDREAYNKAQNQTNSNLAGTLSDLMYKSGNSKSEKIANFQNRLSKLTDVDKETMETKTFGATTEYDKGVKIESSKIGRVASQVADMSLTGGIIKGMFSDEIQTAIDKDLVSRELVNSGIGETIVGTAIGVSTAIAEGMLLGKFANKLSKVQAKAAMKNAVDASAMDKVLMSANIAKKYNDFTRYAVYGAVVPTIAALNDEAGSQQKFTLGDMSSIGSLAADAAQNVASMWFGDRIAEPILKNLSDKGFLNAIKNSGLSKKAKADGEDVVKLLDNDIPIGNVANTNELRYVVAEALGKKAWYDTARFGGEFAADMVFDFATTTGLNNLWEKATGNNLFTNMQTAMYDLGDTDLSNPDVLKNMATGVFLQRAVAKVGGHFMSRTIADMTEAATGNKKNDEVGTKDWINEELGYRKGVDKGIGKEIRGLTGALMSITNKIYGNEISAIDQYIQTIKPGENLLSVLNTGDNDKNHFVTLATSYFVTQSAESKLARSLALASGLFGKQDEKIAELLNGTHDEFNKEMANILNNAQGLADMHSRFQLSHNELGDIDETEYKGKRDKFVADIVNLIVTDGDLAHLSPVEEGGEYKSKDIVFGTVKEDDKTKTRF